MGEVKLDISGISAKIIAELRPEIDAIKRDLVYALETIRDQVDTLRFATPEMTAFWLDEIASVIDDAIGEKEPS